MLYASQIWNGRIIMDADNDGSCFLQRFQLEVPPAIADIAYKNETKVLPHKYEPNGYDVVCGRGRGNYSQPGNKRLHLIVQEYIQTYSEAKTKLDKTLVLDVIVDRVQEQNNGTARFVKFDRRTGWVEIGAEKAREKVGHVVRQALFQSTNSEKVAKNKG